MDLKITIDAQNKDSIKLDKLFQFTILGKKTDNDFHRVDQFNAVVFRFDSLKRDNTVHCTLNINSHDVDVEKEVIFTDKSEYYKELDILKQFWGQGSYADESKHQFLDKVNEVFGLTALNQEDLRDEIDIMYGLCKGRFPLIINEEKDGISPFILLPMVTHFTKSSSKANLKVPKAEKIKLLQPYISFGFWFNFSFQRKLKSILSEFLLNSKIEFESCIKCPDFKVYYQVDSNVKVKSNAIVIDHNEMETVKGEIIRVFSQSKISYFKDWAELGIYNSALFRFENSRKINSLILNNGVRTISADINLEDALEANKKQIQIFILSIVLSVLVSMGFDATRQSTEAFKLLFPDIQYASNEFTWALLSIGVALKYYYFIDKGSKISVIHRIGVFILSIPLIFWLAACFFVEPTVIVEKLSSCRTVTPPIDCHETQTNFLFFSISNWLQALPVVDIFLSVFLILSVACCNYHSMNKRTLNRFAMNFFKWTFGVK